jgi:ABC-2 type transport system permease protein
LGLTQIAIWLATLMLLTAPGVLAVVGALPDDVGLPRFTVAMALNFAVLYTLGFFAFATLYGAIGAAFNNVQEAQQVAGFVIFFLVAPIFLMYRVINDPESTLAVVSSLIPPFSPLMMTLRIGVQMPPVWQILLCDALLLAFVWLMVSLCARIYRVGILMYGKKPTVQEIWRWLRYA